MAHDKKEKKRLLKSPGTKGGKKEEKKTYHNNHWVTKIVTLGRETPGYRNPNARGKQQGDQGSIPTVLFSQRLPSALLPFLPSPFAFAGRLPTPKHPAACKERANDYTASRSDTDSPRTLSSPIGNYYTQEKDRPSRRLTPHETLLKESANTSFAPSL